MYSYDIFTDSACDLPQAIVDNYEIGIAMLSVSIDGKVYKNYLDEREITYSEFFGRLRNGANATTSAANIDDFENGFRHSLEMGRDILYIGFSSALSSTFRNGQSAAENLLREYPDRRIFCFDSHAASLGEGKIVCMTAEQREKGLDFDSACEYVQNLSSKLCHWFTVDDLFFLNRGGRVSSTTALFGSMLNIKPILHVDDDGNLINMAKARGRKSSIKALFDKAVQLGTDLSSQTVFICHGDCIEDAKYLERLVRDAGVADVVINQIGPVIGAHSGPGTVGLFFEGTER